jgi:hypothetical protein
MQTSVTARNRHRIRTGEMRPARQTAAARIRAGDDDFLSSFALLQGVIERACAAEEPWEAKVAAAIRAGLECAAEHPGVARALTIQARGEQLRVGKRQEEAAVHFARMLRSVVPKPGRRPIATEIGTIEAISAVVRGNLESGSAADLASLAPDLIFLALLPHLSVEQARKWAERR